MVFGKHPLVRHHKPCLPDCRTRLLLRKRKRRLKMKRLPSTPNRTIAAKTCKVLRCRGFILAEKAQDMQEVLPRQQWTVSLWQRRLLRSISRLRSVRQNRTRCHKNNVLSLISDITKLPYKNVHFCIVKVSRMRRIPFTSFCAWRQFRLSMRMIRLPHLRWRM